MSYQSKTDRKRGTIWRYILGKLRPGRIYTCAHFPRLTHTQARDNLNQLYRAGQIIRLAPGTQGRLTGRPARYMSTIQVRQPLQPLVNRKS